MKKIVYARVEDKLYKKLQEQAKGSTATVSATIERLVGSGLSAIEAAGRANELAKEASALRNEVQELHREKSVLAGRLQIYLKNESLAATARHQAESIKKQLEQVMGVGVATCGNTNCNHIWRLYDVWHHQCPECGNSSARLLTHYIPADGDEVQDIPGMVGGVSALVALLKAIDSQGTNPEMVQVAA